MITKQKEDKMNRQKKQFEKLTIIKHNYNMNKTIKAKLLLPLIAIIVFASFFNLNIPQNSYAAGDETAKSASSGNLAKCGTAIGVGYLIYRLASDIIGTADGVYVVLKGTFDVNHSLLNQKDSPATFEVWKAFRTIANVLLVLTFLIIIFSQLTNYGLSNYSAKKMLPKVLLAIVLINISFYIMQILVDLSNIAGNALFKLFSPSNFNIEAITSTGTATEVGLAGILALICAQKSAGLFAILAPIALTILITIVTTFVILVLRQALVITTVVASPIFFILLIFPKGESMFKSWKKAFLASLILYPIMGVLFGAGALISSLIGATAGDSIIQNLAAALIKPAPLLLFPSIIQKALASVPMISGTVNKASNWFKERGDKKLKASTPYRMSQIKAEQAADRRRLGIHQKGDGAFSWVSAKYHEATNDTSFGNLRKTELEQKILNRNQSAAELISIQDRQEMEKPDYNFANLSPEAKAILIKNGINYKDKDAVRNLALMNKIHTGDANNKDIKDILNNGLIPASQKNAFLNQTMQKSMAKGRFDNTGYIDYLNKGGDINSFNQEALRNYMQGLTPSDLANISHKMLDNNNLEVVRSLTNINTALPNMKSKARDIIQGNNE